jgi:hypothetical protein
MSSSSGVLLKLSSLNDDRRVQSIEEHTRAGAFARIGHPAVLCYVIGSEIPAPIVRWYGRHRVERFLKELYEVAKDEDPEGLVTYVNYPTTEYLQLYPSSTLSLSASTSRSSSASKPTSPACTTLWAIARCS